tara:strand:- start:5730 stop:6050 length:321 start_codon:yes stop_codon:yes gene_type:complete
MANVKLTWNDNSTNESGFNVYRNDGSVAADAFDASASNKLAPATGATQDGTIMAGVDYTSSSSPSSHEYIDLDVAVGTYTYRVAAFNDAGETFCTSPNTITVSVTA